MTTNTSDQQLVMPASTDLNDGPTVVGSLLGANPTTGASGTGGIESRLVKRYLSVADRSTRNPTPATNEISTRADAPGKLAIWGGSAWFEWGVPYVARQTLGASAGSVVFSGIPSNLRRIKLFTLTRSDQAVNNQNAYIRINNDSGNNYNSQELVGQNATPSATNLPGSNVGLIGNTTGTSAAANQWAAAEITFVGWDTSTARLGWVFTSESLANGAANFIVTTGGGQYLQAAPYTSITIMPAAGNFVAGSDFQLQGDLS